MNPVLKEKDLMVLVPTALLLECFIKKFVNPISQQTSSIWGKGVLAIALSVGGQTVEISKRYLNSLPVLSA